MATIDQINQDMTVRAVEKWSVKKRDIEVRERAKRRFKRVWLCCQFATIAARLLFVGILILRVRTAERLKTGR